MRICNRSAVVLALMMASVAPAASQTITAFPVTYVVMGADGPVARAIYPATAAACPQLTLTSSGATSAQTMSVRALPQSGNPPPDGGPWFPVLVCELLIPPGTTAAALGDRRLPLPPAGKLESIAVIGDTGCRLKAASPKAHDKDQDEGKFQDCDVVSKWPFSTLAASVAKKKPQVLVHVGDYHYRESPCPKGDKGCAGSPYGDNWDAWNADFFKPGAPLLAAAPWIATRGNHESCKRAGTGYMLFLDVRLAQNQQPPTCTDLIPHFTVTVSGQPFIILDSTGADDVCPEAGCNSERYAKQFETMTPAPPGSWLVTHRPVWGFKNKGPSLNATLQAALKDGKLPSGITLSLAGHIHLWEALSFHDRGTPQLVLGNGGTSLAQKIEKPLRGRSAGGRIVRYGKSVDKFGFTIFTPETDAGIWTATYYDKNGNDEFMCLVTPSAVVCSSPL